MLSWVGIFASSSSSLRMRSFSLTIRSIILIWEYLHQFIQFSGDKRQFAWQCLEEILVIPLPHSWYRWLNHPTNFSSSSVIPRVLDWVARGSWWKTWTFPHGNIQHCPDCSPHLRIVMISKMSHWLRCRLFKTVYDGAGFRTLWCCRFYHCSAHILNIFPSILF